MSNINPDNQGDDNNKKLEEGLMFAEEEKIKPINQTSLFKGKSCLKKEKEKGQNKFAVKIKEPEEQKEKDNGQENNEEFKERRKRTKFKTVKEPTELKNKDLLNYGTEDNNNQNQQNNNNNVPAFNNPFHLDPAHEDIQIERRLDQNMFCPLVSLSENFGEQNDYYSMRTIEPLKESFFHSIEALIFPEGGVNVMLQ